MHSKSVEKLLKDSGAFLHGHFQLSSGLHSDAYVQCMRALVHPDITMQLAHLIADIFKDSAVDVVCGPAMGGITLAFATAHILNTKAIFSEYTKSSDGTKTIFLKRGFEHDVAGKRVLIVEDAITTGKAVRETLVVLRKHFAEVVGISAIINRAQSDITFDNVPFKPLMSMALTTYEPYHCPLCRSGVPVTIPGSRQQ